MTHEPGEAADSQTDDDAELQDDLDPRFNEADAAVAPGSSATVASTPFGGRDKHDAVTRRALAFTVIGLVAVLYGAAVLGILASWIDADQLGKVALVLGPIQALAAAVLGFYFGQNSRDSS